VIAAYILVLLTHRHHVRQLLNPARAQSRASPKVRGEAPNLI
jgi:hypothetical protein